MLQHILNKNSIPHLRIRNKHMSHCPDHMPILYNRRPRHPLHNPPCILQQPLIRHAELDPFIISLAMIIRLLYFNLIRPAAALHRTDDLRLALFDPF